MTEAPSSSQRAQGNKRLIVISLRGSGATRKIAEMLKFPRKEEGNDEKEMERRGKEGKERRGGKGKIEREKGKETE